MPVSKTDHPAALDRLVDLVNGVLRHGFLVADIFGLLSAAIVKKGREELEVEGGQRRKSTGTNGQQILIYTMNR